MRRGIKIILIISVLLNFCLIFAFGTITYKKIANTKVEFTTHYFDRKTLFSNLPNQYRKIIFLGDSITEYCNWNELFKNNNILNRGIGEDTTTGVIRRLSDITKNKPSKVFLMIGINDIGNGDDVNEIVNNYKKILLTIKKESPSTIIYIQSVLPCNDLKMNKNSRNKNRTEERITSLNKHLQAMAINLNIIYIDLNSKFKDNGNLNSKYTNDGVHLNGQGYLLWKNEIERYVN